MNKFERLHNQGNEQQSVTRELGLSMGLRAKCEQLLEEKGHGEFDDPTIISLISVPLPLGIINMLRSAINNRGLPSLKNRVAILVGKSNEPEVKILSTDNANPSKARVITVHIPMLDNSPLETNVLKLERGQRGKTRTSYVLNHILLRNHLKAPQPNKTTLTTMNELEAYQRYINQSSPIEHK